MSIYVSDFTSATEWQVLHDEGQHGGTIDPATVKHTVGIDGVTEDHNFLVIQCPVCDSVSTHPVGGGAQPQSVQQMFVNHASDNGCPCGQVDASDPNNLAESHVKLQILRMDGPGRSTLP
ncbi:MAG TPA: hypothetical protein VFB50_00650 [Chloroflexota bacterium]|nr:hypothetical protein [Chloroflexota bacterium]